MLDCAKEGLACAQTTQANSTHAQTGRKELGGLAFSSGQYLIMQCTFFFNSRVFCQPIDRFLRIGVTRVTIKAVPIIFCTACITLKQATDKTKFTDERNKKD